MGLAFLKNVNSNYAFCLVDPSYNGVWLEQRQNKEQEREQRTIKAKFIKDSRVEKRRKHREKMQTTNFIKKKNPIQTLKTSGNAEIGLITAKDDNCCHPGDGEKSYFLLLLEERHKHRSSQSHAERQYKTLIKSDSDSHINWRTIQYKIGPNWEKEKSMGEVSGAPPQQERGKKKCFQAVSGFLPTHWERGPERRSCTVAARAWRHLARSGRELVSLRGLERVWSLVGEWVEIQGITQGGVPTTEQQSAKRPFHWNGNFYCWEAAVPCDVVPSPLFHFRATRAFMKLLLLFSCSND